MTTNLYKASIFAKKIGVHIRTLYNWEKSGQLIPFKTVNTHRYYSHEQLEEYLRNKLSLEPTKVKRNIGYGRVSSHKQSSDLERQIENLETYLTAKGKPFEIVTDIGSGLNYKKKGLNNLIQKVMDGEVETVVVTYEDRLVRFGVELLQTVFDKFGTTLEVINSTEGKTDEEELVEDMIQLVTVFSGRLHGKRKGKTKALLKALDNDE